MIALRKAAYSVWPGYEVLRMRQTFGMTQRGFAREVGCSLATLRRWETGKDLPSVIFSRILTALANQNDYFVGHGITGSHTLGSHSTTDSPLQIADQ